MEDNLTLTREAESEGQGDRLPRDRGSVDTNRGASWAPASSSEAFL